MKKSRFYTIAFFALTIYALACSLRFMQYFSTRIFTTNNRYLRADKHVWGDFYGLSHLKKFKHPIGKVYEDRRKERDTAKAIDLTIIGDSYTALSLLGPGADSSLYATRINLFYFPIMEKGARDLHLDTSRRNLLLIQRTERDIFPFYRNMDLTRTYLNYLHYTDRIEEHPLPVFYPFLPARIMNQMLETICYSYAFLSPLKELKAGIEYNLFGRIDPLLYESTTRHMLYFKSTVDSTDPHSSFFPVKEADLDSIVAHMNFLSATFKQQGFDEVVFSFTPNPVTIVEGNLHTYNQLIPRIQQHRNLQAPMVDVYTALRNHPQPDSLYHASDSHWNANGYRLWVDQMNLFLRRYIAGLPK